MAERIWTATEGYGTSVAEAVLLLRKLMPQLYLFINQASWFNARLCLKDLEAFIEQFIASCSRMQTEKIRNAVNSLRVILAMPSVDYFKKKKANSELEELVSLLIRAGAPLR